MNSFFVSKIKCLFIMDISSGTEANCTWSISFLKIFNILERILNLISQIISIKSHNFLLSSNFLNC